ncbi:MAG: 23S rRNA (pseudouridine(1915)-N(3))-methyltransferase RlmH [Syntrophomonadaceae bacterium]|jgi:23S rRNA (pseudouridine1915-N3)-methyltransferase
MRYRIISVGRIKESFYSEGINNYLKRIRPYLPIDLIDGLEEKTNPYGSSKYYDKIVQKEGEKVLNILGEDEILVVCDMTGKPVSSEDWARLMGEWNNSGKKRINLIIGGSHGTSRELKNRAQHIISFSKMTFPHHMAVLILCEQIYRGIKIMRGEPYHK